MKKDLQPDWFITDDDCLQCCRFSSDSPDTVFEFTQINRLNGPEDEKSTYQVAKGHVDLEDYTGAEKQDMLSFYGYGDFAGFQEAYPDVSEIVLNQYMAEMFFETEVQEYVCATFSSWNKAVDEIQRITNLDVASYKEAEQVNDKSTGRPVKTSLDQMINVARQNTIMPGAENHDHSPAR